MKPVRKHSWTDTSESDDTSSVLEMPHTHVGKTSNLDFSRCLLNVKDHKFGYHFNMEVELLAVFVSQFHLLS